MNQIKQSDSVSTLCGQSLDCRMSDLVSEESRLDFLDLYPECRDQERNSKKDRNNEKVDNSCSTLTSNSIGALFQEEQTANIKTKLYSKINTRRKVWGRWKNIVRGMYRR